MKKARSKPMTPAQQAELEALAALPDDRINTAAVPEQHDWRGALFRPIKKQLTLRLDADVIDWFKTHAPRGEGYQTKINRALREYVTHRETTRRCAIGVERGGRPNDRGVRNEIE